MRIEKWKWAVESSKLYYISPTHLREISVERDIRNRENAYSWATDLTEEEKKAKYDDLKQAIQNNGFDRHHPIIIMLKRLNNRDAIVDGHHRLNIAIELGLETVPVKFVTRHEEDKGPWP